MTRSARFLSGLKSRLHATLSSIASTDHERTVARHPAHDDLYVVSYPKSGATWMNFLMANVHLRASGDRRSVNFFNVHDFVPDIDSGRDIGPARLAFPGHRVIKSHAGYNPLYRKVVYVVRDPRAVMVSYYHFLTGLKQFDGSLSDFIRSPGLGIASWRDHVNGWYTRTGASTSFQTFKYEDLKADVTAAVTRLYRILGYDQIDPAIVAAAVEASSFEKMRSLEQEYDFGQVDSGQGLAFMREGKTRGWVNELSEQDQRFIVDQAAAEMARFGYKAG